MKKSVRVQSIDRAIAIFECFKEDRQELKLSEIAHMLDLNKSTVHGILSTLKYHGFIDQDEFSQKYKLGFRFLEFSNLVLNSMNIRNIAYPIIERVCFELEETVHLAMLDGQDVVYIEKRECNRSIKTSTEIGARLPAHLTADGRVILCYMEREKLNEIIPDTITKLTPTTIVNKHQLIDMLSKVKADGYAVDREEVIKGLVCVAAPILDYKGTVKYSFSISGPAVRITDDKINDYIVIVKQAAREISNRIGYRG